MPVRYNFCRINQKMLRCHEKYCPYVGVHWSAERNKWRAQISKNHVQYYIDDKNGKKDFETAEEACKARDRYVRKKRLDLKMLNFPTEAEIAKGAVTFFFRKILEFFTDFLSGGIDAIFSTIRKRKFFLKNFLCFRSLQ